MLVNHPRVDENFLYISPLARPSVADGWRQTFVNKKNQSRSEKRSFILKLRRSSVDNIPKTGCRVFLGWIKKRGFSIRISTDTLAPLLGGGDLRRTPWGISIS